MPRRSAALRPQGRSKSSAPAFGPPSGGGPVEGRATLGQGRLIASGVILPVSARGFLRRRVGHLAGRRTIRHGRARGSARRSLRERGSAVVALGSLDSRNACSVRRALAADRRAASRPGCSIAASGESPLLRLRHLGRGAGQLHRPGEASRDLDCLNDTGNGCRRDSSRFAYSELCPASPAFP